MVRSLPQDAQRPGALPVGLSPECREATAGRQAGAVWVRADLADAVVPQTPPLLFTCSCPHRASLAIGLGAQVFLLFFILASN